jgi:hypothetical protein
MSLCLIVSLVYQDREPTKSAQAVCVQTSFVTPLSFATPVETFRSARTARVRGEGAGGGGSRTRLRVPEASPRPAAHARCALMRKSRGTPGTPRGATG